jgi:hypothetical protein
MSVTSEHFQILVYSLSRLFGGKPMFSENAKRMARDPTTTSDLEISLPPGERAPFRIVPLPQERHNVGVTSASERTRT